MGMRINSKGQVTTPKEIRKRARLLPGTEVEFLCEGDVVKIVPVTHGPKRAAARGWSNICEDAATES